MIYLFSHGFKYSRPEANFIFDVSYFPNPWRDTTKEAKEVMGNIEPIVSSITNLIIEYEKLFPQENMRFAICCSAGEYRSPVIVKEIHQKLLQLGIKHNYDTYSSRI